MLEQLKFVQHGVASKEIVPGTTHFRIENGRCTGYNGAFAISAPVDISFNVAPSAKHFIKALNACEDVITLKMDGSSLLVRSGKFRTYVPCIDLSGMPRWEPEGLMLLPHGSLLSALSALKPFVGVDASRPWAMGVLLAKQSAFATNNMVIAEYWMGTDFPGVVNVPSSIIDEVVTVSEELSALQIAGGSITFHYTDGRWIKSQLLALDWPDALGVLNQSWQGANLLAVPAGLAEACEKLARFGDKYDNRIFFHGSYISTKAAKDADQPGAAHVEMTNCPGSGCYHARYLNDVLDVAETIGFDCYPHPVPFQGARLRGVMLGMTE